MNRSLLATLAAVVTLASSGCAGGGITQVWRDPAYASPPVKRLFVLVAVPDASRTVEFENALASAFISKGFEAATASSAFPPGPLDKVNVRNYLADSKVDLVVAEHVSTQAVVRGTVTTTVAQGGGWWGMWGGVAASQTRIIEGTDVTARIEVWDVRSHPNVLVWQGEAGATDIKSAARSHAKSLVGELERAGILVK